MNTNVIFGVKWFIKDNCSFFVVVVVVVLIYECVWCLFLFFLYIFIVVLGF